MNMQKQAEEVKRGRGEGEVEKTARFVRDFLTGVAMGFLLIFLLCLGVLIYGVFEYHGFWAGVLALLIVFLVVLVCLLIYYW